ncbi:MAG: glycerate kinase, partial [Clostridia bacterium]|nr:glycerate kinase [Clostridia bacterium]
MRIVIAIDSFKGSLTTFMSASAITEGIKRVYQDVEILSLPLADGGEGT